MGGSHKELCLKHTVGRTQVCKANLVACCVFARGRPQVSPPDKVNLHRRKQIINPDRLKKSVGGLIFMPFLEIKNRAINIWLG